MAQETHRFQIGAIPCMVVADMTEPLSEERVRRIFTQDADRMVAAFHALPTPQENAYNILYLESGGQRIVIDTGIGHLNASKPGRLIPLLHAEGIEPEQIDIVILTHFHGDHIGGLLDAEGKAAFPKARLVTAKAEYDYWTSAETMATLDAGTAERFRQTFAVYSPQLAAPDAEVAPGVCLVAVPGHTPGQSGVLIESQGERLLHIIDTIHTQMQLNAPEAIPSFDKLPEVAIKTRRAIFERAQRENLLLLAYHLNFPGLGHIERQGDQLVWTPYKADA